MSHSPPTDGRPLGRWDLLAWVVLLATAAVVLTRQLFNESLGYPDADRILMDGVFLYDFLRDLPLDRIYDYTIDYFGQYPALSIGYRPPFFPFVEAIFNALFGVSMWSSRLAILLFACVGLSAWFLLVRRLYDTLTALAAGLLLVSLPFFAKWGWYTMAELPLVSMTMLTAYLFHRYAETDSSRFLFATAFTFGLSVWTKQTAFYLAFWMLAYLWVEGSLWSRLKQAKTWAAVALVLVMLTPLALITLWLGDQNLAQSVGDSAAPPVHWAGRLKALLAHPSHLVTYQLTAPVLVLSGLGVLMAFWRRDRRAWLFGLLILATYLFFSYIANKNERYSIFWLPAFATFAALPLYYLRDTRIARPTLALGVLLAVCLNVYLTYSRPPNYATGYREAAAFVLEHSRSPTVFVDAYNNGYFTYFMRALDDDRSVYVLRADKLLTSSAISAKHRLEVHVQDRAGIRRLLDDLGVQYIVVEERNYTELEAHQALRDYLADGPFDLERRIPVDSTRPPLEGQAILVYRYREPKQLTADSITLRLPVVGQTITVPVRATATPR